MRRGLHPRWLLGAAFGAVAAGVALGAALFRALAGG